MHVSAKAIIPPEVLWLLGSCQELSEKRTCGIKLAPFEPREAHRACVRGLADRRLSIDAAPSQYTRQNLSWLRGPATILICSSWS